MYDSDHDIRQAAFARCSTLMRTWAGAVPWMAIGEGFEFEGKKIFLGSKARGIHKPTQMRRGALSIKTIKPKRGRSIPYEDQMLGADFFRYDFFGTDPQHANNQWLQQNFEDQSPFIYFWPITQGVYQILYPCFIQQWDPHKLTCSVSVGNLSELIVEPSLRIREETTIQRRYSTVVAKQRLHQAEFRERVLNAYDHRCAISGLPIVPLLQAAHIIPDSDKRGDPTVSNGICLSNLHHSAFDRNLLGIDPNGLIHIAKTVLATNDGPTLEYGLKAFHNKQIRQPTDRMNDPNSEFLAQRFDEFLQLNHG